VQNGMVERNAGLPPERCIEFRVGIHLGDVVEESDYPLPGRCWGNNRRGAAIWIWFAVGTAVTGRPPHRTARAEFPHAAPTLGV
jgi:hypothetical protein